MTDLDEIQKLLIEIRDNQNESLKNQQEHIDLSKKQLERAKAQVEESIGLQREAIAKQRTITRIAIPGILLCIAAILYLIIRYF